MEGHKLSDSDLVLEGKKIADSTLKPFGKLDHEKITKLTPLKKD